MSQNQALPVADLDPAEVGRIVIALAATSALAGHTTIRSTVGTYVHPAGRREMEFVRDVFIRSTAEITTRWYGGEFEAASIASEALGDWYGGSCSAAAPGT